MRTPRRNDKTKQSLVTKYTAYTIPTTKQNKATVSQNKTNKRSTQPPESPRARKVPRGRPSRKRKPGPGPEPVPPTSAARWRANRRAHKSARTQYNPCPGTAVPATCIPLLVMTVDISMNRANGMILLDEDEEEAWEAQLRMGTGVRLRQ